MIAVSFTAVTVKPLASVSLADCSRLAAEINSN